MILWITYHFWLTKCFNTFVDTPLSSLTIFSLIVSQIECHSPISRHQLKLEKCQQLNCF
jgi:hypothetical protein